MKTFFSFFLVGLNFGTSFFFTEGTSSVISNVGALPKLSSLPPITLTPPDPEPNDIELTLPEDLPSMLSVSNSLSSIIPDVFVESEVGCADGAFSTPAAFISLIASAAASFTSLAPSPVIIRALSITSEGISQETPFAIEAKPVIAVALTLES
ncbi:uncharacterized protein METZ01_LOCUS293735 [marine metagenome]|uniref:Uncharacterized protein n=1 Tax=marine metagenome TaxID=408172 RepID=A0A382M150_9ZZZZ